MTTAGPVLTYEHEVDRPRLGLVMVVQRAEFELIQRSKSPHAWGDLALAREIWPGARVSNVVDRKKLAARRLRAAGRIGRGFERRGYTAPAEDED